MNYGLKRKAKGWISFFVSTMLVASLTITFCGGCDKPLAELNVIPKEAVINIDNQKAIVITTMNHVWVLKGTFRGVKAGTCIQLMTGKLYKFSVQQFLGVYPELKEIM